MQDAKMCQKSPSGHHRTTLSGYIFATKALIDNRKKLVKQQYLPRTSSQYGERRHTSGWDPLASLGHPCKFQRVSRLGSVTARHSSTGCQPNFAALNRGRHLYSAGQPSRCTLAHILVKLRIIPVWHAHHQFVYVNTGLHYSRLCSASQLLTCSSTFVLIYEIFFHLPEKN